ncbi:MAG: hypothetical protein KDJ26_03760 [Alphaproteobacteria bacterium]|jgi:hypothetical protein|nr:hypothetical protein [Alphaproteobacteria bacterium]MCB1551099.1 hypothetical protein [Alphaproteobacteria bacterium]MCB9985770.1 hypothetical protein [Micavibrio sp.]HPQ50596.1 hypothetical protein [Alphaproteobacteria bacterium]HRK97598.1 hypothetical protein [Alphaproteobacteria bacterium]
MNTQNGNAFLYILIAVILFGALMFTISRTSNQENSTSELDAGRVAVAANEILGYAASASNAITQMQATAVSNDNLDFMLPSDTDFNTDTVPRPNIYKVFHPSGGGLSYRTLPKDAEADDAAGLDPGYYIGRFNSVEWTPSTTPDILFVAYEISTPVCQELNRKLVGSTTIPAVTGETSENLFIDDQLHAGTNADFNVANCAACEEKPALCISVSNGIDDKYVFYSILEAE